MARLKVRDMHARDKTMHASKYLVQIIPLQKKPAVDTYTTNSPIKWASDSSGYSNPLQYMTLLNRANIVPQSYVIQLLSGMFGASVYVPELPRFSADTIRLH